MILLELLNKDWIMTKKEFYKTGKLYHYTGFDTALNILETNELWFNHLKDLNDINELYRPLFYERLSPEIEKQAKQEIGKYQQISLTRDDDRYGFDIPAMWGHYGDKGRGVCFIFNKEKFLKNLSTDIYHGEVEYVGPEYPFSVLFEVRDDKIEPFTKEDIDDFFFKKTNDWSYEQEFRFLVRTDASGRYKLPLRDSMIAIIIRDARIEDENHNVEESSKLQKLKKLVKPSCFILDYGNFIGTRHLQYTDHKDMTDPHDDTIWCSQDDIYDDLKNGKVWIEGTHEIS